MYVVVENRTLSTDHTLCALVQVLDCRGREIKGTLAVIIDWKRQWVEVSCTGSHAQRFAHESVVLEIFDVECFERQLVRGFFIRNNYLTISGEVRIFPIML